MELVWVLCLVLAHGHLTHEAVLGPLGNIQDVDLKESDHSIQMVDNDPEFLVGVRGMQKPLCFHIEGATDEVVRLLQDPVSGVIVNARIFHDSLMNKTYLGAIMIARGNFRMLAKQRYVMINDGRFNWDDITALNIQGHRVVVGENMAAVTFRRRQITLVIRRHFASRSTEIDYDNLDNDRPQDNQVADNDDDGSDVDDDDDDGDNEESGSAVRGTDNRADIMPPGVRGAQFGYRIAGTTAEVNPGLNGGSMRRRSLLVQNFFNVKEDRTVLRKLVVEVNQDNDESGGVNDDDDVDDNRRRREPMNTRSQIRLGGVSRQDEERQLMAMTSQQQRTRRQGHSQGFRSQEVGPNGDRTQRSLLGEEEEEEEEEEEGELGMGDEAMEKRRNKTIFLGVYIADSRGFSNSTHGLLGQFLFKNVTLEQIRYRNGRMKARLLINGDPNRRTLALLTLRRNLALNTTRACWKVRQQGRDVIDGWYLDYVVPNLRHMEMKELPPPSPL